MEQVTGETDAFGIASALAVSPVNSHSKSQQSFLLFPTLYSGHALLSEGVI
jgi:hypothetical protein